MPNAVQDRLQGIHQKLHPVVADKSGSVSPALKAVLDELHTKLERAGGGSGGGADDSLLRDALVEAEEAADSAKAAVQAESSGDSALRDAVIEAHKALSELKKEFLRTANLSGPGRSPAQERL